MVKSGVKDYLTVPRFHDVAEEKQKTNLVHKNRVFEKTPTFVD
jgi:hypothetical protein